MYIFKTDVPASSASHNDNRCDADVPLAGDLFRQFHRLVLRPFLPLSSSSHRGRCFYSVQDSDKGSGAAPVSTVMQAHVAHIPLNGTAASGRTAYTQYPASSESTSHRGSSFGTDRQGSLKPSESTSEEDLEKGVDN